MQFPIVSVISFGQLKLEKAIYFQAPVKSNNWAVNVLMIVKDSILKFLGWIRVEISQN